MVPLNRLRDRADALRADELESTPLAAPLAARRDELGELAQALEHMAERLRLSLAQQRLLLRTLSHELRTPLARLRIAHDSELPPEQLRQRLDREIGDMQRLLEDTLDLAWMDTERPQLPTEPVLALSVWEALRDDACFESGWDPARLPCRLGVDCRVEVHLDSLAQAMENLLRNAIRHSPENGTVSLDGEREGDFWHLRLQDQGPGVAEDQLERIFLPTSAWTIAPAKVSASAWRSPGAPSSYRAAGSGPATASPDCACTCGCRRPPEGEVFRKLMRFTLK